MRTSIQVATIPVRPLSHHDTHDTCTSIQVVTILVSSIQVVAILVSSIQVATRCLSPFKSPRYSYVYPFKSSRYLYVHYVTTIRVRPFKSPRYSFVHSSRHETCTFIQVDMMRARPFNLPQYLYIHSSRHDIYTSIHVATMAYVHSSRYDKDTTMALIMTMQLWLLIHNILQILSFFRTKDIIHMTL